MPDVRVRRPRDHARRRLEADTEIELLQLGERVLAKNDELADHVRGSLTSVT